MLYFKNFERDRFFHFTGTFTAESFSLQRLVTPSERSATIRWQDQRQDPKQAEYYYVRVQQHNGHMAWSNPIWGR